jgi:sugar O-acyltransferase (sialic acid O-acetyltransferase NeuD family)
VVIIGAKGLAKEILLVLHENGEEDDLCFFDDINPEVPDRLYGKFPVIRSLAELKSHFRLSSPRFALGFGGPARRAEMSRKLHACGGVLQSIIARSASIGCYGTWIGPGVCILTQAIITSDVAIGEGTLINKAVIIGHDVTIGQYCEIAPGARIMGRSRIGDFTEIGANAVILPDTVIGSRCRVDAGSVVRNTVQDRSIVIGVPPKVFRST